MDTLTKYFWLLGLLVTLAIIALPLALFLPRAGLAAGDPWDGVPRRLPHIDHSALLQGPFESGPQVTRACLDCHPQAAGQVMGTVHWTWESKPYQVERRAAPVTIGKKNSLNNFCLGIQSNWPACTTCHAGYGWEDADFDFTRPENVDCLVCHDLSGGYVKGQAGIPLEGVDLLAAARSVGLPTRENCGNCHFNGGGGNGVKHGDLDQSLYFPPQSLDVHMGGYDFQCIDCHQTQDHQIRGRSISVGLDSENQVACLDCHQAGLHQDARINAHTGSVACQACHIPSGARRDPTKMEWDWSTAGQDLEEDPHAYLKYKGSFVYESDFIPEYYWYKGVAGRYLMGDPIDPDQVTLINSLDGDISDPQARIFPFKVHLARQPYDALNNYLLQPQTAGEGGFFTSFDWDDALRRGAQATGLPYSGDYGFAETLMYWPLTHMVAPAQNALQCANCHGTQGRLDWQALGYPGDPLQWGGRSPTTP